MRRFIIALSAMVTSLVVVMAQPRSAEAMRPPCPRGDTFVYCTNICLEPIGMCNAQVGVPQQTCPVIEASCDEDVGCRLLNSNTPYALTCTWQS